ncbi:ThuA domain-containing protein [Microbacterium sp. bgisy189]|uniref:ThuA domain-containing protein n=1 Tax=Microbacterium sp. bgisy189 TaxID=3413798 RepID=UPI003EBCE9B9
MSTTPQPTAVIASGAGRYADPWHPFPDTSPLIADVLEDAGFTVRIDDDIDGAMTRLDGVDLIVVNAGDPWRDAEPVQVAQGSLDGFAAAIDRGIGILAFHCATATLRDYPDWAAAVGAMWVPSLSMHPDAGVTTIRGGALPDGTPIDDFELFDERYCRLQQIGRRHIVARHDGADDAPAAEPTAWVREYGAARVAVDVLGHDVRSYESPGHRALIAALAGWVTTR